MPAEYDVEATLDLLEMLVQIGAPTGREHRRAMEVAMWLDESGLGLPEADESGNLWLWLGPKDQQAIMLEAHLDTVFPDEHISLHKDGDWWYAPGISDNTVHVAMLMSWARQRHDAGKPWPATVLAFTTGEEGRGNLRGMREVTSQLQGRIRQAVVLDCGIRSVVHQAVGSIRWDITFTTQGGHSWSNFGQPSAIQHACQWIAAMPVFTQWQAQHTTFNVGEIRGGQTINVIAPEATFTLEIRSIDPQVLQSLRQQLEENLQALAAKTDGLQVDIRCIGDRPAGRTDESHPLIHAVQKTHETLGIDLQFPVSSTNANWLMHLGIPAICTGLAQGRLGHTRDEALDISVTDIGLRKLDMLFDLLTRSTQATTVIE